MNELKRCFKECWEEHEVMIEEVERKHAITLKAQLESWYQRGWIAAEVYCEFKRDELGQLQATQDYANYWKQEYIKLQNAILKISREGIEVSRDFSE